MTLKIGYKCDSCNKVVEENLQEHHLKDRIYCNFCLSTHEMSDEIKQPLANTTSACRTWSCSQCSQDRACVIMVNERLICVKCRFDKIGKSALYEGLYNGNRMEMEWKWISVKDRLPKDNQRCLILERRIRRAPCDEDIYIAYFSQGEHKTKGPWRQCDTGFDGNNQFPWCWIADSSKRWFSQDVLFWMELPIPPNREF